MKNYTAKFIFVLKGLVVLFVGEKFLLANFA